MITIPDVTAVDVGSYEFTISAVSNDYSDVTAAYTLTVQVLHLCTTTEIQAVPVSPINVVLNAEQSAEVQFTDSVSLQNGDKTGLTYCGARTFTLVSNTEPWLTFDETSGVMDLLNADITLVGTSALVTIRAELDEYPSVPSVEYSVTVNFNHCYLTAAEFTWAIPAVYEQQLLWRRDYDSSWTFPESFAQPLGGADPVYTDGACAVVLPLSW